MYLTTVFNMKTITATTLITVFNGTTNFATLLGAFMSDTYFGRYTTLGFASIASFLVLSKPYLPIPYSIFNLWLVYHILWFLLLLSCDNICLSFYYMCPCSLNEFELCCFINNKCIVVYSYAIIGYIENFSLV